MRQPFSSNRVKCRAQAVVRAEASPSPLGRRQGWARTGPARSASLRPVIFRHEGPGVVLRVAATSSSRCVPPSTALLHVQACAARESCGPLPSLPCHVRAAGRGRPGHRGAQPDGARSSPTLVLRHGEERPRPTDHELQKEDTHGSLQDAIDLALPTLGKDPAGSSRAGPASIDESRLRGPHGDSSPPRQLRFSGGRSHSRHWIRTRWPCGHHCGVPKCELGARAHRRLHPRARTEEARKGLASFFGDTCTRVRGQKNPGLDNERLESPGERVLGLAAAEARGAGKHNSHRHRCSPSPAHGNEASRRRWTGTSARDAGTSAPVPVIV